MTTFNDLPNELIVEVWRQVLDPKAVESFALTSKTVYALGRNVIQEHNELKAKFSSIDHYELHEGGYYELHEGSDLVEALQILLLNSRAALYVRNVYIDRLGEEWGDVDDSEQEDERSYSEDTMELFKHAIEDNPLISEDEVVSWLDAFAIEKENAIIPLIITMLPKLHSLALPHVYSAEALLFNMIKRIAECKNTEVLSLLREVRLLPGDMNRPRGFDWIRTLAKLPSVKAIEAWDIAPNRTRVNHDYPKARRITDCHGPYETHDSYHTVYHESPHALIPKTSAITHLTFINCIIDTRRLVKLLDGLQALESFQYHSPRALSNPNKMVDALLANAKHTLRKLRLRSDGGATHCPVTLTDFAVMDDLEIRYDYLLDDGDRRKLANILPPSIEKVHLSLLYTSWYEVMVDDVLEMTIDKAERLPNLKGLTIEVDDIGQGLCGAQDLQRRKCEEVGVDFNLETEPTQWSLSWTMAEEWRERKTGR